MTQNFKPIDRRQLILNAAKGGLGLAAFSAYPLRAATADAYDMIIIGAGTAGVPCAIFAAQAGAKVLMIEKSGMVGGTLWLTGGSMAAAGTRVQARQGIKDSPDAHFADITRLGHGKGIPEVIRTYVDNAAPMADWLEDIGFKVREGDPVPGRVGGHASFSIARYFQGRERGRSVAKVLMPELRKQVDAGRVKILLNTGADEIMVNPDKSVGGVIASGPDGLRTQFNARKVVITSGGYCHSPEMFTKVTGLQCYSRQANSMSKGQGLVLGEGAGGFIRGGENQILNPTILNDRAYPTISTRSQLQLDQNFRPQWEIRVNQLGKRFVREDEHDRDLTDIAFTHQPAQKQWVIFDQKIMNESTPLMYKKSTDEFAAYFNAHPMYTRADTLEELARRNGINGSALAQTIKDYNAGVRKKSDAFGREFLPSEIGTGPYYAVEMAGSNLVGFGGLAINGKLEVINRNGDPIRNLYAAGEVIGLSTIAGNVVVGGTGVTPSLTFGRLLGMRAMATV